MTNLMDARNTAKLAAIFTINVLLVLAVAGVAKSHELEARVLDTNGTPAFNAVVYAYPVVGNVPGWNSKSMIVDQIDKEFTPNVTVVPVGTPIFFPNDDDIRHHVYSFSLAKTFELPLYSGKQAKPVVFDKPGVVTLGCNIHDWMVAYIYVTDTPFHAKTGKDGVARIENLESGKYDLFVWHPWMKGKPEDFKRTVVAGVDSRVEFNLKLKANLHIRRAPAIGRGGGY